MSRMISRLNHRLSLDLPVTSESADTKDISLRHDQSSYRANDQNLKQDPCSGHQGRRGLEVELSIDEVTSL